MKKISYWAKEHKGKARIAIVVSYIFLNALAFFTGQFLNQIGIFLLPQFLFGCFFIFLVTFIAYPQKRQKGTKLKPSAYYRFQKTCDFVLAASTFCMIVCLCNRPERLFQFYPQVKAFVVVTPPKDSVVKHYKSVSDFYSSLKDGKGNTLKWKERKKLLKQQIREIRKDNNLSKGNKIALIFLSCAVALGLIFLVAALACNLSCDGYGALAVIVGIGGTALIIFLLAVVIRAINGKKRKKKLTARNALMYPK